VKRNVFSLDLKTATESLLRTVCGSEFQIAGGPVLAVLEPFSLCNVGVSWLNVSGWIQLAVSFNNDFL